MIFLYVSLIYLTVKLECANGLEYVTLKVISRLHKPKLYIEYKEDRYTMYDVYVDACLVHWYQISFIQELQAYCFNAWHPVFVFIVE